MITPEQKDALLIKMINDPEREWLGVDPEYAGIDFVFLSGLMRQFVKYGFITQKGEVGKCENSFTVVVEQDADDFIFNRGGFKFQEDFHRNQFTKLELEPAKLEKENPEINFDNATKLIGAVASGLDIYKHFNA